MPSYIGRTIFFNERNICQYKKFDCFGSEYGFLTNPYKCGIEPTGSVSHGVIYLVNDVTP